MKLFNKAIVTDINDPEDMGRVKVKFIDVKNQNISDTEWITLTDDLYSGEDNGWHGTLAVGDWVIVCFMEHPYARKPFLFKKIKTKTDSIKREGKELLKIKDHTIIFEDDKITLKHSNGITDIVIKANEIDIRNDGTNAYSVVRAELLKTWLENLFVIGNLGYPTATVLASGYIWNPLIINDKIKIS